MGSVGPSHEVIQINELRPCPSFETTQPPVADEKYLAYHHLSTTEAERFVGSRTSLAHWLTAYPDYLPCGQFRRLLAVIDEVLAEHEAKAAGRHCTWKK